MAQIIETPEKVIIVTGTPFSSGIRLLLVGAAIGAGGMYYFLTQRKPEKKFKPARDLLVNPIKRRGQAALDAGQAKLEDALDAGHSKLDDVSETVSGAASGVAERAHDAGEALEERAKRLFNRVKTFSVQAKDFAVQAKDFAQTTGEALKPTMQSALEEGKRAAADVQSRLKDDVRRAGDRPALAEEDGELPSQKPDKLVE